MNSEEDDEIIDPGRLPIFRKGFDNGPFDKDPDDDLPFRGFDEPT